MGKKIRERKKIIKERKMPYSVREWRKEREKIGEKGEHERKNRKDGKEKMKEKKNLAKKERNWQVTNDRA